MEENEIDKPVRENPAKGTNKKRNKQKKGKRRLIALIIVMIVVGGTIGSGLILYKLSIREIARDITVENENGVTGVAFVVFRPGISSFQEDITDAFIRGLVERDWRVEVTTSSNKTPTDVSKYDLIVLGTPVYGGYPQKSVTEYLQRVDLGNKPVVLIQSSLGSPEEQIVHFREQAEEANGRVVVEVGLQTTNSNAISIAYEAGNNASLVSA